MKNKLTTIIEFDKMVKDAEEQDGELINFDDLPTTPPPTTVTAPMSPILPVLLLNEPIISPQKVKKRKNTPKYKTCNPCQKILMSDDTGFFKKNQKLHGLHCVSCDVLLTPEHIKKSKLNFWYCNHIGVERNSCQNVECSTCYSKHETNRK
jgi:hypothetical protein